MELRDIEDILQYSVDPLHFGIHLDNNMANSSTLDGAIVSEDDVDRGCEVCEACKPLVV